MKPEKITYTWHMNGVTCNMISLDDEAPASDALSDAPSFDPSPEDSPETE